MYLLEKCRDNGEQNHPKRASMVYLWKVKFIQFNFVDLNTR